MEDIEEKRRQEAYTAFAKIAIKNSKGYEGSSDIDKKIKRLEAIRKALLENNYKSAFQYENCDDLLLDSDEESKENTR